MGTIGSLSSFPSILPNSSTSLAHADLYISLKVMTPPAPFSQEMALEVTD